MVVFLLLTQAIRVTEDVQVFAKVYTVNLILTAISVAIEVGWAALGEAGTRAVGICGQPNTLANHLAISLPLRRSVIRLSAVAVTIPFLAPPASAVDCVKSVCRPEWPDFAKNRHLRPPAPHARILP